MTLPQIEELSKKAIELRGKVTPYEEKPGSKCPECNLETYGYRHWMGCELEDKRREYNEYAANHLAEIAEMNLRLVEVLKEISQQYDQWKDQGHHCESKKALQSVTDKARALLEGRDV